MVLVQLIRRVFVNENTILQNISFYYYHRLMLICSYILEIMRGGGIRGTVVARWTAGQQVERLTLPQDHGSYKTSSHYFRLSSAQFSLRVQNRVLKHHSFHFNPKCVIR